MQWSETLRIRRFKMMAWTRLIYISKIFIESLNPMDQGKMRLWENKDAGDILKGSSTVFLPSFTRS